MAFAVKEKTTKNNVYDMKYSINQIYKIEKLNSKTAYCSLHYKTRGKKFKKTIIIPAEILVNIK